jgi:hypothetical protein
VKAIARFYICLTVLVALAMAAEQLTRDRKAEHERAMKASEVCFEFRQQKLTRAEAFPMMSSMTQWIKRERVTDESDFMYFSHSPLPMCRYETERGCWIPMVYVGESCSKVFPNGIPKEK